MLKIAKIPEYLSPSSLMKAEGQPNRFYAERMSPNPLAREPQGLAAAAGSSFDSHVKNYLIENVVPNVKQTVINRMVDTDINLASKNTLLDILYDSSVEEQNLNLVRSIGLELTQQYRSVPFVKSTCWVDFEKHIFTTPNLLGVPLFMKLDAVITDPDNGSLEIPFDWKVKGYNGEASPPPGYKYIYSFNKGIVEPPHKDYTREISIDSIDMSWATQLTTYGWGIGCPIGIPFKVVVDCLLHRTTGWRVARYEAWSTITFQKELIRRYQYIWRALNDGSYVKNLVQEPVFQEWLALNESWWM